MPATRAEGVAGIEEELAAFERSRGEWMRRLALWIGRRQQRLANNILGRLFIRRVTTPLLAWAIVRFRLLDIGKQPPTSAPEIVTQWLRLAKFFHAPVEVESAGPGRVVVCHHECTMGFKLGQGKLCRSSMNMDVQIIRRLGGTMTVEYTLAEGADHCRHVIEFGSPAAKR